MAPSIDDYENRRRCWLRSCPDQRIDGPFCAEHWDMVPDDLKTRIEWAYENGDTMDWLAAIRAAMESLRAE